MPEACSNGGRIWYDDRGEGGPALGQPPRVGCTARQFWTIDGYDGGIFSARHA